MQPQGTFYGLGFSESEIATLVRAYSIINSTDMWDLLARRDVPGDSGFVNPNHPDAEVIDFLNNMKMMGIEPFGFIMRQMEFIAKKGWSVFVIDRRYI